MACSGNDNAYELERKQRMEVNSARMRELGLAETMQEVHGLRSTLIRSKRGGDSARGSHPEEAKGIVLVRRSARQRDIPAEMPRGQWLRAFISPPESTYIPTLERYGEWD